MPTYEYRCVSCQHQFERFQRITDEPVKECEVCGQPVKRLLFPVAIHFKGDGFYTTDYGRRSKFGGSGSRSSESGAEESRFSGDSGENGSSDNGGNGARKSTESTLSSKGE